MTSPPGPVLVAGMSRSGTTLLTSILDAHADISCAAELIPTRLGQPGRILATLEEAARSDGPDLSAIGRTIRTNADRDLGLFCVRAYRGGLSFDEVRDALAKLVAEGDNALDSFERRLALALDMIEARQRRENATLAGFKLASANIDQTARLVPNAHFLCLARDPIDVAGSQKKRGFDRTPAEVADIWNAYVGAYTTYCAAHPERALLMRYEDLVRTPLLVLARAFRLLGLPLSDAVIDFHKSGSRILDSNHPNENALRSGFFQTSIGSGEAILTVEEAREVRARTRDLSRELGYDNAGRLRPHSVEVAKSKWQMPPATIAKRRAILDTRKKFDIGEYGALLERFRESHTCITLGELARKKEFEPGNILIIRHDIDHDIQAAVAVAKREAELGWKSTFCVLHTAWYYGELQGGRYTHSDLLISGIERIVGYGHEINFHNNLATLTLTQGIDPFAMLEAELSFFLALGVPVTGSSTHGDKLCRSLNFRNWELFSECCDDRFGGPREVVHVNPDGVKRRVALGSRSMREFGLEYESYDFPRRLYVTDSGGTLRERENCPGRGRYSDLAAAGTMIDGVLTHPDWWRFSTPV